MGQLRPNRRLGSMMPTVALTTVIILVGAVYSVDVAYMHLVRAELRTATDAAARAATETLSRTENVDEAIDRAIFVAKQNAVAGQGFELSRADIRIGVARENTPGKLEFLNGDLRSVNERLNSVEILGKRDQGSPQGRIPLFFAPIFGVADFAPSQTAIASFSVSKIDVVLVLDISGSMRIRDGNPQRTITRTAALKEAANAFMTVIEKSPDTQVGVVFFNHSSRQVLGLTKDHGEVRRVLRSLSARGGTNIASGINRGSNMLRFDFNRRENSRKVIVVMTDGRARDPTSQARTANSLFEHVVHTVTLSNGADKFTMRRVAEAGGGRHVHSDNVQELTQAFEEIGQSITEGVGFIK